MNDASLQTPDARASVAVESHLLGHFEVEEPSAFILVAPMPGFGGLDRFVLLETERPGVYWLQFVDDASSTLCVADPFALAENFQFVPTDHVVSALGCTSPDDLRVLVVLNLSGGDGVTANLDAPVVLNPTTRLSAQVLPESSTAHMRTPVVLPASH